MDEVDLDTLQQGKFRQINSLGSVKLLFLKRCAEEDIRDSILSTGVGSAGCKSERRDQPGPPLVDTRQCLFEEQRHNSMISSAAGISVLSKVAWILRGKTSPK